MAPNAALKLWLVVKKRESRVGMRIPQICVFGKVLGLNRERLQC